MHRIPCGRIGCEHVGKRGSGQPVFLQHGLLSSSADWLLSGPEKALGKFKIKRKITALRMKSLKLYTARSTVAIITFWELHCSNGMSHINTFFICFN